MNSILSYRPRLNSFVDFPSLSFSSVNMSGGGLSPVAPGQFDFDQQSFMPGLSSILPLAPAFGSDHVTSNLFQSRFSPHIQANLIPNPIHDVACLTACPMTLTFNSTNCFSFAPLQVSDSIGLNHHVSSLLARCTYLDSSHSGFHPFLPMCMNFSAVNCRPDAFDYHFNFAAPRLLYIPTRYIWNSNRFISFANLTIFFGSSLSSSAAYTTSYRRDSIQPLIQDFSESVISDEERYDAVTAHQTAHGEEDNASLILAEDREDRDFTTFIPGSRRCISSTRSSDAGLHLYDEIVSLTDGEQDAAGIQSNCETDDDLQNKAKIDDSGFYLTGSSLEEAFASGDDSDTEIVLPSFSTSYAEWRQCYICKETPWVMIYVPCGHRSCDTCYSVWNQQCPHEQPTCRFCQADIDEFVRPKLTDVDGNAVE